jgi:hypothetical protein
MSRHNSAELRPAYMPDMHRHRTATVLLLDTVRPAADVLNSVIAARQPAV